MHRFLLIVFCFLFSCVITVTTFAEENFLLLNATTDQFLKVMGSNTQTRISPCSTFKIVLSLMGFDKGILQDEEHPKWQYNEQYDTDILVWKSDQTPRSWMQVSCVWYSQLLTPQIGLEKIQEYLKKIPYGNQDMTGDPGKNNGLTHAWLNSSLKISPQEQVLFVKRLIEEDLPFSQRAIQMTKTLLFREVLEEGWQLFGKTGLAGKQTDEEPLFAWFVGWIEKEGQSYVFAYHIQQQVFDPSYRILRVKQLLKEAGVMDNRSSAA